jgi:hypothetical protein
MRDGDDACPGCAPASERHVLVISSKGRFFVSRKPDCAKVRELSDAFRGAEATHRMHLRCVEVPIATCWDTRTAPMLQRIAIRFRVAGTSGTASPATRTCMLTPPPVTQRKSRSRTMRAAWGIPERATIDGGARGTQGQWPSSSNSSA